MKRYLYKLISSFLRSKRLYLVKSLVYDDNERKILRTDIDLVRVSTAELCAREIESKKLKGSIAEVGVYKGDFASVLNGLFPSKTLYLFDTFTGFDSKDTQFEKAENLSKSTQDFSNTSTELVLSKMEFPERCVVKKGFFPTTTDGINDTFCFVSLDADLYQPIYAGLVYFYERLEKGGYIFIDDYNNSYYKGSKEAVRQFCTEMGITPVPIPDSCGGVIITK